MAEYRIDEGIVYAADEPEGNEWVAGRLMDEDGRTWLGCIECGQQIVMADSGMCAFCREDAAANGVQEWPEWCEQ